jgi:prefoldin subunit 5
VERLNRQRADLAEQRTQLEAEIQRASLSAKASKPELEKLQKLEVNHMLLASDMFWRLFPAW